MRTCFTRLGFLVDVGRQGRLGPDREQPIEIENRQEELVGDAVHGHELRMLVPEMRRALDRRTRVKLEDIADFVDDQGKAFALIVNADRKPRRLVGR